jgi:signal recognition particle receptor subunit beta
MALINDAKKEIHAKIVYYGPAKAGKTTNLEFIYNKLKPEYRGKFKFLNTPSGRMVFFDFMRPELAGIKDFSLHFHIYTVPGEVVDDAVWKNVLKGVDGIVFVADLDPSRMLENRRSLDELKATLAAQSSKLEDIPCIFQLNKKDLPDALSQDDMRNLLDSGDVLLVPAAAHSAAGVLPTLSEMVKMILQKLRDTPLGEEDQSLAAAEEQVLSDEAAEEQVETPEPIALSADTEVSDTLEQVAVQEYHVVDEELVEQGNLLDEELALSSDFAETTGYEPAQSVDDESTFDAEEEALNVSAAACSNAPESEPWSEAFTPSIGVAGSAADESQPEIVLDGTLESLGNGRFRLPLVIRYADKEKRTSLTLSLGFE